MTVFEKHHYHHNNCRRRRRRGGNKRAQARALRDKFEKPIAPKEVQVLGGIARKLPLKPIERRRTLRNATADPATRVRRHCVYIPALNFRVIVFAALRAGEYISTYLLFVLSENFLRRRYPATRYRGGIDRESI